VRTPLLLCACLVAALLGTIVAIGQSVRAADGGEERFQRIPTQFIAALGDPDATSGSGAQAWGVWRVWTRVLGGSG
jgi:hypothetical protein